ncbi:uncharacterized protein LOC143194778 [Rhynchophorus ferrugineus]|uniref:uncharacterized protein LOC143194778 n=1 Tax=Rhynchophorus ferrugineus TaxID=354439 RepID=UPI003FCED585
MRHILFFTFILIFFSPVLLFGKTKRQKEVAPPQIKPIPSQNCDENCMCLTCNYTLPDPKKIINPYRMELKNYVPRKPFGSFCIKCVACLAVARQIEKIIRNLNYECEPEPLKKSVLTHVIMDTVRNLCSSGFKNFDLREYKNKTILTDDFRCSRHVETNMDGNWTKKLRELCQLYISRINLQTIGFTILDSCGNITDTICRGNGIFRDCFSIHYENQETDLEC